MDTTIWIIIGGLGMWLIECSYMPQIARLWRRKEADDVSVLFPGLNFAGRALAVAYSIHAGTMVLAFGFFFGLLVRATFLGQVVYYRYLQDTSVVEAPAVLEEYVTSHAAEPAEQVLRAA